MKTVRYAVSAAAFALFCSSIALAQTTTPPNSTDPSSASSPSQRDATQSPASEAPADTGSNPSDASTPAQREAMAGKPKTMKECMDTQAAKHPTMSKSDMTKACTEQMKAHKDAHQE